MGFFSWKVYIHTCEHREERPEEGVPSSNLSCRTRSPRIVCRNAVTSAAPTLIIVFAVRRRNSSIVTTSSLVSMRILMLGRGTDRPHQNCILCRRRRRLKLRELKLNYEGGRSRPFLFRISALIHSTSHTTSILISSLATAHHRHLPLELWLPTSAREPGAHGQVLPEEPQVPGI